MSASNTMCLSEAAWPIVLLAHVHYSYVTGAMAQHGP